MLSPVKHLIFDSSSSHGSSSTPKTEGYDASKNELLRAMDLRLIALRGELFLETDRICSNQGNNNSVGSLSSGPPVEYGASPAKVVQMERQSSSEVSICEGYSLGGLVLEDLAQYLSRISTIFLPEKGRPSTTSLSPGF